VGRRDLGLYKLLNQAIHGIYFPQI